MKKLSFLFILSFLFLSKTQAQGIEKGQANVNVGAIFNNTTTPITGIVEYGLFNNFSVSAQTWFSSTKVGTSNTSSLFLGGRGTYYLNDVVKIDSDKFNTYAGVLVGKSFITGSGMTASAGMSFLGLGGAKYNFSEKLGIYAELNLGFVNSKGANLAAGLSYRLK